MCIRDSVYVARRLDDQSMVAIKMLDPSLFGQDEAMRRFERELRVQSRIKHPNTVKVHESGRTPDGLPYLILDHVEGELLSDLIEDRERLPWSVACHIAGNISSALDAAHEINIVHRDLSPENILIVDAESETPTVKVLDLSLIHISEPTRPY